MRKTPIRRHTPLRPGKPTKRKGSSAKREANFARAYGGEERVLFVKGLHCIVSASRFGCDGPIENAHIVGGGIGRKSDARHVVPLCAAHHRELHAEGPREFERRHVLDLREHADGTEALWRRHSGLTPIADIVPGVVADLLARSRQESA